MAQGKSCEKSDANKGDGQKAEEKEGSGWRTDPNQNKSEEDNDLCPSIQMVDGTLDMAMVIQKGMLHQLAFLFNPNLLEKLRPRIFF